jgi:hypothetical protein
MMLIVGQAGARVRLRVPWQEFKSVALMVKVWLALLVGVPERTPVLLLSVNPAGRLPLLTVNTWGAMPPLAVKVAL